MSMLSKKLVAHLARCPTIQRVIAQHHNLNSVRTADGATFLLAPFPCGLSVWSNVWPLHMVTARSGGVNHVDQDRKRDGSNYNIDNNFCGHFGHLPALRGIQMLLVSVTQFLRAPIRQVITGFREHIVVRRPLAVIAFFAGFIPRSGRVHILRCINLIEDVERHLKVVATFDSFNLRVVFQRIQCGRAVLAKRFDPFRIRACVALRCHQIKCLPRSQFRPITLRSLKAEEVNRAFWHAIGWHLQCEGGTAEKEEG